MLLRANGPDKCVDTNTNCSMVDMDKGDIPRYDTAWADKYRVQGESTEMSWHKKKKNLHD